MSSYLTTKIRCLCGRVHKCDGVDVPVQCPCGRSVSFRLDEKMNQITPYVTEPNGEFMSRKFNRPKFTQTKWVEVEE